MKVDMDAILKKAQTYLDSSEGQKQIQQAARGAIMGNVTFQTASGHGYSIRQAANKFIETLRGSIAASGLSAGVASALNEIEYDAPVDNGDGTFSINIHFVGNLKRKSLYDEEYPEGVDNLAALYNNGVDHMMSPVYGTWHGELAHSRTVIPGLHFIEQAKQSFMAADAAKYGVIDIQLGDDYK
ncbi:MAG: hypothetical protein LUD69_07950 [Oscillospiraceae bacterium]|nr:hypothetical protein [Oscillospiraceae bacterium]